MSAALTLNALLRPVDGTDWVETPIIPRREGPLSPIVAFTHPAFPGLAIHHFIGGAPSQLAITHIATGHRVMWFLRAPVLIEPAKLERAMRGLVAAGDWTRSGAELQADEPARNAMYAAVCEAYGILGVSVHAGGNTSIRATALKAFAEGAA